MSAAWRAAEAQASVPFESKEWTFERKLDSFFSSLQTFYRILETDRQLYNTGFALMMILVSRIMMITDLHPRLRILVGTLRNSFSDLVHLAILFCVIFVVFAYVGTWMFGDQEVEFASFSQALWTQFGVLVGGGWRHDIGSNSRLTAFMVLSTVTQYLLMLNFLLAIIVEGYMQVRREIEEVSATICVHGLFEDAGSTFLSSYRQAPPPHMSETERRWV